MDIDIYYFSCLLLVEYAKLDIVTPLWWKICR